MADADIQPVESPVHTDRQSEQRFRCTFCGEGKPQSEFGRSQVSKSGRHIHCNPCRNAQSRARYANSKKTHEIAADRARLRNYGIFPHEFEAMHAEQAGLCAICQVTLQKGKKTAVDHCHKSGRIRALLCTQCNTSIGVMRESPDLLRQMAAYIEAHSGITPQLNATAVLKSVIAPSSPKAHVSQHRYIKPNSAAAARDAGRTNLPQPDVTVPAAANDQVGWLPGLLCG